MPSRKSKRRYLQVKTSPRAGSYERVPLPEEAKWPSLEEGALCERCEELELRDGLYSLNLERGCSAKLSSKILQRLFFDDPPEPTLCFSCQRLKKFTTKQGRLRASRVNHYGVGTTEPHRIYTSCWFTLSVGELSRTGQKRKTYNTTGRPWLVPRQRIPRPSKRHYRTLETYLPLSSNPQFDSARMMSARPNYATVSTWLGHCSRYHTKCQPLKSASLKLISLIDVETNRLVPYPLDSGGECDYIALSYVLGDSKIPIDKYGEIPGLLPTDYF